MIWKYYSGICRDDIWNAGAAAASMYLVGKFQLSWTFHVNSGGNQGGVGLLCFLLGMRTLWNITVNKDVRIYCSLTLQSPKFTRDICYFIDCRNMMSSIPCVYGSSMLNPKWHNIFIQPQLVTSNLSHHLSGHAHFVCPCFFPVGVKSSHQNFMPSFAFYRKETRSINNNNNNNRRRTTIVLEWFFAVLLHTENIL